MTSTAGLAGAARAVEEGGAVVDMTLPEALQHWVSKHPDKRLWTYLDDRGRETSDRVTYRELDDRTRALSLALLGKGGGRVALARGDRVLLVYPPSLHFSVAFVACLRAGLVAVPVYPPDPRKLKKDMQAFSRIAASCGASVALTCSSYNHAKKASAFKAKLTGDDSRWPDDLQWVVTDKPLSAIPPGAEAEQAAAASSASSAAAVSSSSPSSSAAVADEATAITKAREAAAAAGGARTAAGEGGVESPGDRDNSPAHSSLAFLQYTSGSTGDPKGVKISHGNLAHNLGAIIAELKAGPETVVVSWLPQYHDMGLIGSVLGALYCGGSGYYLSPLDFVRSPPTWITAVDRFRGTHLQAPNFAFALTARKWKALKTKPTVDLSSVVHLINAAEPVDAASLDAFEETFRPLGLAGGVIKPTYGLAEHTVFVCSGGMQRITVDRKALEVDKKVNLAPEDAFPPSGPPSPSSPSVGSLAWCKLVGCGYPGRVRGLEVLVVDPASRRALPDDCVGEVWLRSPSKARGYWGLPEKSREVFCALPSLESAAGVYDTTPATKATRLEEGDKDDEGEREGLEGAEGDAGGGDDFLPVSALELHSRAEQGGGQGAAGSGGSEGSATRDCCSDGYLRTGDEGFLHKGELFICGRIKDLIIVGGRNYYPQDLERTAECGRNASIRPGCSAAFSVPGRDGGGELLVLTAELREEQVKVSEAKRRELGEEIRSAIVSEHGVDVRHLLLLAPRENVKTTSGKIARQRCRRAFLDGKMEPILHLDGIDDDGNSESITDAASAVTAAAAAGGEDASIGEMKSGTDVSGASAAAAAAAATAAGVGAGNKAGPTASQQTPSRAVDASALSDGDLLGRLQGAISSLGDGTAPDPDAPFYTLGLSSMTAAQFSGLLEQEYGAHVPLSLLDADGTTLRSLVPVVKAEGGGSGASGAATAVVTAAGSKPGEGAVIGDAVVGVGAPETMIRESPGKCEETIMGSCPCCMCLLSCPCCM